MISHPQRYLIHGGRVVDGTGTEPYAGDVMVNGDTVEEVRAPGPPPSGCAVVDADGCVVTPGFIDLHTHCDFTLPTYPRADSMVRQGVTTIVTGNCGHSAFPLGAGERAELTKRYSAFLAKGLDWRWTDATDYLQVLSGLPLAVNIAPLVGHGTIRIAVMGFDSRTPDGRELEAMRDHVDRAMAAGAFGVSTGLIYAPGTYAETDEIVALASVAARHGGFYATHIRNEGPALVSAVDEAVSIAERAGTGLQLSHHKVLGRRNWGLTETSLRHVDQARERGLDVTLDQYPYEASSTTLTALLPPWVLEGGVEAMAVRLGDPSCRARARTEIVDGPADGGPKRDFEPETVLIASAPDQTIIGRTLSELGQQCDQPAVDVMLDLLGRYGGAVEVVIFAIGEHDIRRVMRRADVAVASDGWTLHPDEGGTPHPRSYGTFARVLGHYVRDEKVLTLPEAIRKMTTLPARRLGLRERGRISPGLRADLAVFDPATIRAIATFTAPHRFCEGVRHVIVNGAQVIRDGQDTGAAAGRPLRHSRP